MGRFISPSLDPDAIVREVDKTDGYERWVLSDSGSRRRWTTGPTIAVRSAQPSRRSV